jgi:hypothetical protein
MKKILKYFALGLEVSFITLMCLMMLGYAVFSFMQIPSVTGIYVVTELVAGLMCGSMAIAGISFLGFIVSDNEPPEQKKEN